MIGAGIVLLAVGGVDLTRRSLTGLPRAVVLAALGLVLLIASAGADAAVWSFVAVGVAVVWVMATPDLRGGRAGFWPVALVAAVVALAVALVGVRTEQGPLGDVWPSASPLGVVSLDAAVLVIGALAFLLESGNVIVRIALRDGEVPVEEHAATLKGGRLIGPIERVLVFALTLASAFTLLAAVLAAKGIVRFPEISRDGEGGIRAEYFLIGSLVSWTTAFAIAFLVWWGTSI